MNGMKYGVAVLLTGGVALAASVNLPQEISGYYGWKRANPNVITSGGAHPALKDVFVNDVVAKAIEGNEYPNPVPEGGVVVKERTNPDTLTVDTLYTMRKREGFDPDRNNWQYGKWDRTEDGSFKGQWLSAQGGSSCAECHAKAEENDYLFLNYLGNGNGD